MVIMPGRSPCESDREYCFSLDAPQEQLFAQLLTRIAHAGGDTGDRYHDGVFQEGLRLCALALQQFRLQIIQRVGVDIAVHLMRLHEGGQG